MLQNAQCSVRLKSGDGSRAVSHALLLWNVAEQSDRHSSQSSSPTYVQYISFRLSTSLSSSIANSENLDREPASCLWSHPVRLRISPTGKRHTLALPVQKEDDGLSSRACCMAVQTDSALVYMTLADDKFPFFELENNCDIPLFYGYAATDTANLEGTLIRTDASFCERYGIV